MLFRVADDVLLDFAIGSGRCVVVSETQTRLNLWTYNLHIDVQLRVHCLQISQSKQNSMPISGTPAINYEVGCYKQNARVIFSEQGPETNDFLY